MRVNLTEFSVRRPVTILMIVLGLVVVGSISFTLLPVRQLPSVHTPVLQVSVNDPGADPQDVRTSVTDVLENALTTVNGVSSMTSVSMQGVSDITLQFLAGTNMNTVANDVAQAVHRVQGRLPATASLPSILQSNPASMPIETLSLSGKLNASQLDTLAQKTLVPALESVPGVASVNVQGGLLSQVNVMVNTSALEAYHVTLQQVRQALVAQNATVPGGVIANGSQSYLTATNTPYTSVSSLQQLIVPGASTKGAQGRQLTLGQIATIEQSHAQPTTITQMNGKSAMGIAITAQSDANSLTVANGVQQTLQKLKGALPPGAILKVVSNSTIYTRAALSAVLHDLLLAVLLAAMVLYLFLRRISHTFIVLFAIPTSLIATFAVMYALGFSLDLMSMLALSLLIGILVDDSIVVLENIDRHLASGLDPKQAAVRGRMEIGAAAFAITLTDIVVYAPVAFVHGTIGQLFREFGLTIVAATLFSLFISFTFTPMLASKWLRAHPPQEQVGKITEPERSTSETEKEGLWRTARRYVRGWGKYNPFGARIWRKPFARVMQGYERILRSALRRRLVVVALGFLTLAISVAFMPLGWIHTEFVPQENANVFQVAVSMPTGTSLATTDQAMIAFAKKVRKISSVSGVFFTAGETPNGLTATNQGILTVVRGTAMTSKTSQAKTKPRHAGVTSSKAGGGGKKRKGAGKGIAHSGAFRAFGTAPLNLPPIAPVVQTITKLAPTIPGMQVQVNIPNPLVMSGTQPLGVVISGPQLSVLQAIGLQVQGKLAQLPNVSNVQDSATSLQPEWMVQVNSSFAATYGVNAATIGQAVQTAISGAVASTIQAPGSQIQSNVFVQLLGGAQMTQAQMQGIPIATVGGQTVTLGQVATIEQAPGPVSLNETNRQLSILVTGNVQGAVGPVAQAAQQALQTLSLPPGYTISLGGQIALQNAAFTPLLQAFALSIVLVYMLMAALYESLVVPFVVLFSLPMATVGAFLALLVTGQTLNIFSLIAMIMLMGLVAKNAILLVDYTRTLLSRGYAREEALVTAAKTRLRPIVMTTATMVFSMIPLAIHNGVGSADRMPVAVVLIGGMTTSTLLTLFMVPAMYTYLDDFRTWLLHWRHRTQPVSSDSQTFIQ